MKRERRKRRAFIIDTDQGSYDAEGKTVAEAVKIVARKYPTARVWTIREPDEKLGELGK